MSGDKIKMAFAAIGNGDNEARDPKRCKCDHEVGAAPCEYCAIFDALTYARRREAKLAYLQQEVKNLKDELICRKEIRRIDSKTVAACVAKLTDERTVNAILRAEVERLRGHLLDACDYVEACGGVAQEEWIAAGRGEG